MTLVNEGIFPKDREAMQKRYNLATPQLIETLRLVRAVTDNSTRGRRLVYRIRVREQHVAAVNAALTGSKLFKHGVNGWYALESKDVWNALRDSATRRNTYGQSITEKGITHHCGRPVNSFTFSDGSKIKKCVFEACTELDAQRQHVLSIPMKGAR